MLRLGLIVLIAACSIAFLPAAVQAADDSFGLLFWDQAHMNRVRSGWRDQAGHVQRALEELQETANKTLGHPLLSVVTHGETPPSGDPHDYQSFGTYWWPNPDTKDGLPYVRRDGVSNVKKNQSGDGFVLKRMLEDVRTLALAGYLLDEERYCTRAAHVLRAWFFHPKSRMNPNLNYGQAIPGRVEGRGIGIIDTRGLVNVIEYAKLLRFSDAWTPADEEGLRTWMGEYLRWLRESPYGIDESNTKNNHGTYYDVQLVGLAIYTGKKGLARRVLEAAKSRRLASQIDPDGRQPHELKRTKSLTYSQFNLGGFCRLAKYGAAVGVDLWGFQKNGRGSIRKSADFLLPALTGNARWEYEQIDNGRIPPELLPMFAMLSQAYKSDDYLRPLFGKGNRLARGSTISLLWPMEPSSQAIPGG